MTSKRIRKTEEKPRDEVEEALLRRALGFRQQEIVSEDVVDRKSGETLDTARRRVVTKEVAPDVRALLFWLKNRRPDRWRDRVDPAEAAPDYAFDDAEENL